jgi:hypothetical protein
MFRLGALYQFAGDYAKAQECYKKADAPSHSFASARRLRFPVFETAVPGHVPTALDGRVAEANGYGVKQDYAKARESRREAAWSAAPGVR